MNDPILAFTSKYIDLTDAETEALRTLNLIRSYDKGTVLLREGARGSESYFVLEGVVRYYYVVDGAEKTTDFFVEGDVFEPSCVRDQAPSDHYISCVEDCILSVSTPGMETDMMERFPRLERVCRLVAEDALRTTTDTLHDFKLLSPQQRYEHLSDARPDLIQRVPQYMIASYLGIAPESLSRIRNRMATG
ncbi:MAG: Crp/Fnr family transcriptional regulator [Rubricoccaceae bacterium]